MIHTIAKQHLKEMNTNAANATTRLQRKLQASVLLHQFPQRLKKARHEPHGARELSRRTGISADVICDYLKLLDLEPEVQAAPVRAL
jgi:hypothetical protein